jgi:hypothetical protein
MPDSPPVGGREHFDAVAHSGNESLVAWYVDWGDDRCSEEISESDKGERDVMNWWKLEGLIRPVLTRSEGGIAQSSRI